MTSPGGFDFNRLGGAQSAPPSSDPEHAADRGHAEAQAPKSPFAPQVGQPRSDAWSLSGPTRGAGSATVGVGPPLSLLGAVLLVTLIGAAAAVPSLDGVVIYAAGWFLSGPVALALLVVFARRDAGRQSAMTYSAPGWLNNARLLLVTLILLALIANALRIADWAGRL